jgi:diaminohydroxyphosphoribosylaminopyrimidine deaminase/5-amino-6-(5-phosphoribosylamino)uracil reductase
LIIKKGIKRVFYSFYDVDKRTANKAKYELEKKRIKVLKRKNKIFYDFYNSYFKNKEKQPFVDAKIAVSQDYLTIKKKNKWITNYLSRSRAHLIRSEYDAIMSTSKTINSDNALLNCRLKGFDNTKPDLLIIDLHLSLKKKLNLLKGKSKRKIFIITSVLKSKKINFFKKKGIKIIFIKFLDNKSDFIKLFKTLKNYGFNRILVESGLTFLNRLLKDKLISNLYLFKSSEKLGKRGKNNASSINLKTFKLDNKIKVNLDNDNLYKIRFR